MPPRIALSPRALRATINELYVCHSCISQARYSSSNAGTPARIPTQSSLSPAIIGRTLQLRALGTSWRDIARRLNNVRRYSDSLASRTAINAPSSVVPELRELHRKLLLLQEKASSYVDQSRIQLAMRSLESEDPVTRIAFLGLGIKGQHAARKLVRALLADALGDEAEWERTILQEENGGNILLRYGDVGEDSGVQRGSNAVVKELQIPSSFLKRWNIEVLVSGLNISSTNLGAKELEQSLLDPALTIPGAGRVGFVRFPVHKTVLVAEGVAGAVEFGRLPAGVVDERNVYAVLNLPRRAEDDGSDAAIDVDLATHALSLFRTSISNGAQFSSEWQISRMSNLTSWIAAATSATNNLKLAASDLISNISSHAAGSVAAAEAAAQKTSTLMTISDAKRKSLQATVATWSEEAHRDLQANLSTALVSPTWKRTTWWRLFWRIDEVSLSASDILRRGWLVEAEQSLAWLSGRVVEAGVATAEELKAEANTTGLLDATLKDEVKEYKSIRGDDVPVQPMETVAELMQLPPMLARVKQESGIDAMFDPPWPQTIHLARQQMLHRVVPSMHRKAQVLMLSSLSTIGGTAALCTWLWAASGGVALYEAGAIASLGLVWSLRRLQKKWSKEREDFVGIVKEDGRRVLSDVEGRLTRLVGDGGRVGVREEDVDEWTVAREAIEAVTAAQEAIEKGEK